MPLTRSSIVVALVAICGCATHIKPSVESNPPPRKALSSYSQFELAPLQASPAVHAESVALSTIEGNLRAQVIPLLETWNHGGAAKLRLEPTITDLKVVSSTARLWGGAFAGSSAVVMRMRLVDVATGATIAEPEFYQHANALGGAYSVGATDQDMLIRVAKVAREYLARNYREATGGPTGLEH